MVLGCRGSRRDLPNLVSRTEQRAVLPVDVVRGRGASPRRRACRSRRAVRCSVSNVAARSGCGAAPARRPSTPRSPPVSRGTGRAGRSADRQQPGRGDLARRVEGVQVAGEGANHAEPLRDPDRRSPRLAALAQATAVSIVTVPVPARSSEAREVGEQVSRAVSSLKPSARRSAQVVGDVVGEPGHDRCSGQGCGDRGQARTVDLGVDGRGARRCCAAGPGRPRARLAPARSIVRSPSCDAADARPSGADAGAATGAAHHRRHPGPRERAVRCAHAGEHRRAPPARAGVRTAARRAIASPTSTGSGSRSSRPPLPAHRDRPGPPVDVAELQRADLASPQPEARQHRQDREVTAAQRAARSQLARSAERSSSP